MPLTHQEEMELAALEKEQGLSPDEEAELAALEKEHGGAEPPKGDNPGQAALEGFGETATMGYLPQLQAATEKPMANILDMLTGNKVAQDLPDYVTRRDENIARQNQLAQSNPNATMAGKVAGMAATTVGLPGIGTAKNAGILAKMGASAANAGAQGALYNPGDEKGVIAPLQLKDRAVNGVTSAAFGAGSAAAQAGLAKSGDYLMQKAVGMKKYIPGVGEKLADEGLIGTKGMMAKQAQRGMNRAGQTMEDAVQGMSGSVDSSQIADEMGQLASPHITRNGNISPEDAEKVAQIMGASRDVAQRGQVSPGEAWDYSKAAGKRSYRGDDPLLSARAELGQAEQAGTSKQLKKLSPEFEKGADSYSALAKAHRGLTKPESITDVVKGSIGNALVGGGLGYAAGGRTGAIAGALAGTSAGRSAGGRAAIGASKAAGPLSQMALRAALEAKRKREE
jgi:hypothetical protein